MVVWYEGGDQFVGQFPEFIDCIRLASWVLFRNPVFARMFFRWVSTVNALIKSFSAISRLVRPSVTHGMTSSSLFVRIHSL